MHMLDVLKPAPNKKLLLSVIFCVFLYPKDCSQAAFVQIGCFVRKEKNLRQTMYYRTNAVLHKWKLVGVDPTVNWNG